jgi:hypothetical protein
MPGGADSTARHCLVQTYDAVARLGEVLKVKRDTGIVDVEDRPRAPLVVSGSFGTARKELLGLSVMPLAQ